MTGRDPFSRYYANGQTSDNIPDLRSAVLPELRCNRVINILLCAKLKEPVSNDLIPHS